MEVPVQELPFCFQFAGLKLSLNFYKIQFQLFALLLRIFFNYFTIALQ